MVLLEKESCSKRSYNERSLIEAIINVWNNEISQDYLLKLSSSMKKKIDDCRKNKGHSTKY